MKSLIRRSRQSKGVFCLAVFMVVLMLTACSVSFKNVKNDNLSSAVDNHQAEVVGVVVENSIDEAELQLRLLDSDMIHILKYTTASKIIDEYKQEIDGEEIEVGEIIHVVYHTNSAKIISSDVPKDVWKYSEVQKFSFDSGQSMMMVAGEKYKYTNSTLCMDGDGSINTMELNNQDMLTVRGMGIYVYSIVKTAGHGYIRLANYSDFLGGIAEVGDTGMMVPITENMLITAPEGIYRLTLCKNGVAAAKTVSLKDGEEVIIDYSDYTATAKNVGQVTFEVEPNGADLYLNGTRVNYDKPITLNYGKYRLVAALSGYNTYTGILNVEQSTMPLFHIELTEESSSVATSTPEPTSSSSLNSSHSDSSTVTKKIDSDHTIMVTAPEGAEVFLDNVYKGLAPCTFVKVIGSQTITLSDTGYVTKSYSVDILDDNKDVKLSFADLVKEETTTTETSNSSSDSTSSTDSSN